MEKFQYSRTEFLTIRNTWCMASGIIGGVKVTVPCITSRTQLGNAAQEYEREAYKEVKTAAPLATSSTAAQMTSSFRDVENNIHANFSQQRRGLLSDISSESAQALEAQWHPLIHEATAEMVRRDTRKEEVLSQLRSELQDYHHHAEGQSEEFPQSQAELRHNLERSNAEGVQVRNLEKTRTANASIAPEVVRLKARNAQLSTRGSTMRIQETCGCITSRNREWPEGHSQSTTMFVRVPRYDCRDAKFHETSCFTKPVE